jgi:hypothetical protein
VAKGVLDAETGAMLTQVLETMSKPEAGDERSTGQRRVDALHDRRPSSKVSARSARRWCGSLPVTLQSRVW